jgi:stage II sporulation protein D
MRVFELIFCAVIVQAPLQAGTLQVRILELRRPQALTLVADDGVAHKISLRQGRLWADGKASPGLVVGRADGRVQVRGLTEARRYNGSIEVRPPVPGESPALVLLNRVDEVDYVASVVAAETGQVRLAPAYAGAMARVVWAYTRARASRHHQDYDLCDTTHCQLYQGQSRQGDALRSIVRAESGRPLPGGAPAFFHRCCGGQLDEAAAVWGAQSGTRSWACELSGTPLCQSDPKYRWHKEVPFAQVAAAAGQVLGLASGVSVRDLRIVQRSPGGRAQVLEADLSAGGPRRLKAEAFFSAYGRRFGWRHFHSAAVAWVHQGPWLQVEGRGFGHGVGLCQTGAATLAAKGWSSDQIIDFYFLHPAAHASDAP